MPGGAPQGYTGQMSLGGASFTLGVDEGAFRGALDRAEREARRASDAIGQSLGRGSGAAMGLLYLGQAVDDLQYGFRAIVNNIPQLAMALGAGAGAAGALGIAAVATSQLATHWEELADLFRSDFVKAQAEAMAELAEKTKAAAEQAEKLLKATPGGKAAAEAAINKAAVEEGAHNVRNAIETALLKETPAGKPGPRKGVFGGMLAMMGLGETQAQEARRKVREQANFLLGAMGTDEGSRAAVEGLVRRNTPEFAGVPGFVKALQANAPGARAEAGMLNREGAVNEAITKLIEMERKLADEKRRKEDRAMEAQGAANERAVANQLQGERDAAQARLRDERERLGSLRPSQMFSSVRDFLSSVTTAGADTIRKQQLERLKGIEKGVDRLNQQIRDMAQARFAQ